MAFVRKSVFQKRLGAKKDGTYSELLCFHNHRSQLGVTHTFPDPFDEDEDWYKFDDDKVSIFPKDKIATLDGGGEDSSAYVLLYKSRPLE